MESIMGELIKFIEKSGLNRFPISQVLEDDTPVDIGNLCKWFTDKYNEEKKKDIDYAIDSTDSTKAEIIFYNTLRKYCKPDPPKYYNGDNGYEDSDNDNEDNYYTGLYKQCR